MESHKSTNTLIDVPRSGSLMLIMSIIAVGVVLALAFYLQLTKSAIQGEIDRLGSEVEKISADITTLEAQKLGVAKVAQNWLEEIRKDEIIWSSVIRKINFLVPVDPVTNKPKIRILSYSGSQGGRITVNAQTNDAQLEPYGDVAETIAMFNSSSDFKNVVVPSITRGVTDLGRIFLGFNLNLEYLGSSVNALPVVSVDTAEKVKVAR